MTSAREASSAPARFHSAGADIGGRSTRERYAAAAYEHYVTRGARRSTSVLSLAKVAATIGVSRSQLYRHWEAAGDLEDDIAAHLATTTVGWHHHLDLRPERPLGDAIRSMLRDPQALRGAGLWPAIAADPPGSVLRAGPAAFERRFIARLARHLANAAPPIDHEVPWTDLAVAVTALIEGTVDLWSVFRWTPGVAVDAESADLLADIVDELVAAYPLLVSGPDRPLLVVPPTPLPAGAERILERIAVAVAHGGLDLDPSERRIVNVDDLARTLGVSARFLYDLWPSAAAMNAEVIAVGFDRLRDGYGRLTQALMAQVGTGSATISDDVAIAFAADQVDPSVYPEAHHLLALLALAADHDLGEGGRAVLHDWLGSQALTVSAAMLQVRGRTLRDGRSLRDYSLHSAVKNAGHWRLHALHPELLSRTVTCAGAEHPASGVALHLLADTLSHRR